MQRQGHQSRVVVSCVTGATRGLRGHGQAIMVSAKISPMVLCLLLLLTRAKIDPMVLCVLLLLMVGHHFI